MHATLLAALSESQNNSVHASLQGSRLHGGRRAGWALLWSWGLE